MRSTWMRVPEGIRFALAALWALMTALSIPTLADGVAGWAAWLGFVGSTAASYVFPALGLLGFMVTITLLIAEHRARRRAALAGAGVLGDRASRRLSCEPRATREMEQGSRARRHRGHGRQVQRLRRDGLWHGDVPIAPPLPPRPSRETELRESEGVPAASKNAVDVDPLERLAALYHDGARIARLVDISLTLGLQAAVQGSTKELQIKRENTVREWDEEVGRALARVSSGDAEQWNATSPFARSRGPSALIEPTTTFSGLRDALKDRRAQLQTCIASIGSRDDPAAPVAATRRGDDPAPVERPLVDDLREVLNEADALLAQMNAADSDAWEGSFRHDPVYLWARRAYKLIRRRCSEYAEEFCGPEFGGLEDAYFGTAFTVESRDLNRGARRGYLERRRALIDRMIREQRGRS